MYSSPLRRWRPAVAALPTPHHQNADLDLDTAVSVARMPNQPSGANACRTLFSTGLSAPASLNHKSLRDLRPRIHHVLPKTLSSFSELSTQYSVLGLGFARFGAQSWAKQAPLIPA
jgi:hypothetical protein